VIIVEQGGEYPGETYLWCSEHGTRHHEGMFDGASLAELEAYIAEHRDCGGDQSG
jgi:hypothetical protein